MSNKEREKPLSLNMDFEEALERFGGVELSEMPDSMKLGKKGKQRKRGAETPRSTNSGDDPPISERGDDADDEAKP